MLEKAVIVRVVASEDDTHLTFELDQAVEKTLAKAGDFVELPASTARFVVSSDKKILVAEYMVGQGGGFVPLRTSTARAHGSRARASASPSRSRSRRARLTKPSPTSVSDVRLEVPWPSRARRPVEFVPFITR